MEKEKKKKRIYNILYIIVFVVALALLGVVTGDIIYTYVQNQKLTDKQEELINDLNYLGDLGNDVLEGYYIVYAANDYVLQLDNEEIIIIYEM